MENLIQYLDSVFSSGSAVDGVLKYFYQQQYRDFNPDINGYVFIFMVPPDLSGYRISKNKSNYDQTSSNSYVGGVANLISFAGIDFAPPQNQVNTEQISSRSGAIPYATEVTETDQCSVTYVDNSNLDIYMFHHIWVEYMREILEGVIEPADEYIRYNDNPESNFGAIDYVASIYVVKYRPNMKMITYAAKCIGIFPQGLPAKELIGTRTTNELTTLPFTYFCAAFREATHLDRSKGGQPHWILSELDQYIFSRFSSAANTNQIVASGNSLGGLIPNFFGTNLSSFTSLGNTVSGYAQEAFNYVPSPGEPTFISRVAGVANQASTMIQKGSIITQTVTGVVQDVKNQSNTVITGFSRNIPKFY